MTLRSDFQNELGGGGVLLLVSLVVDSVFSSSLVGDPFLFVY
jgi:hypothetical protein